MWWWLILIILILIIIFGIWWYLSLRKNISSGLKAIVKNKFMHLIWNPIVGATYIVFLRDINGNLIDKINVETNKLEYPMKLCEYKVSIVSKIGNCESKESESIIVGKELSPPVINFRYVNNGIHIHISPISDAYNYAIYYSDKLGNYNNNNVIYTKPKENLIVIQPIFCGINYFIVRSTNESKTCFSPSSNEIFIDVKPNVPIITNSEKRGNSIKIEWTPIKDAFGGYELYWGIKSGEYNHIIEENIGINSTVFTTNICGNIYIAIRSRNKLESKEYCYSDYSPEIIINTIPNIPTGLKFRIA